MQIVQNMRRLVSIALAMSVLSIGAVYAQERSLTDASAIANSFYAGSQDNSPSRQQGENTLVFDGGMTARFAGNGNEVPFFFFTPAAETGRGYVIVSGDERMIPVLGYSDSDVQNDGQIPPALLEMMEQYRTEWEYVRKEPVGTLKPRGGQVTAPVTDVVAPLLSTAWDQRPPYNRLCPQIGPARTVTGCSATAIAQVMNYYKYPEHGNGSVSYTTDTYQLPVSFDYDSIAFDWDHLQNSYDNSPFINQYTNAVSTLMYGCGAAFRTDYTTDASGASDLNVLLGLVRYLGYDSDLAISFRDRMPSDEWDRVIKDEIDSSRPVPFFGTTDYNEGHMFVADGYENRDGTLYFHINWGWGGYCDGNYATSSLHPDGYGIGGSQRPYSRNQRILLGCYPENGTADRAGYLQGDRMRLSSLNCIPGKKSEISVILENLYSYGAKDFDGEIVFYLVDSDGKEMQVGKMTDISLKAFYGYSSISTILTIPSTVPEGTYSIIAKSHTSDGTVYSPVTFGNGNQMLQVKDTGEDPNAALYIPDLQTTGMGLNIWPSNDRKVQVVIQQLCNFGDRPFTGNVSLVLCDHEGNQLVVFGDKQPIENLTHFQFVVNTIAINGTVPDVVAEDGKYRLCAGANQDGCSGWGLLHGFGISGGYIVSKDLTTYFNMWIVDGKVTFQAPDPVSATATCGEGGTVSLSADKVEMFDSLTVSVTPNEGYRLSSVLVNGADVTDRFADGTYTIRNVSSDIDVSVEFAPMDFTVTYMFDTLVVHVDTLAYGTPILLYELKNLESRYTFISWVSDAEYKTMPAKDIVYHALYNDGIYKSADIEMYSVFTLSGIRLKENVTKSDADNLPPGLYLLQSLRTGRVEKYAVRE